MNKVFRNLISMVMALFMVFGIVITASAYNPPVKVVTDTVSFKLTESGEAEDFSTDAHVYSAVRIFNLVQVMKSNGIDPRYDTEGQPIYWYRPASSSIESMMNDFVSRGYYSYDAQSGAITLANGTEIQSMEGVNENQSEASLLATRFAQYCAQNGVEGTDIKVGVAKRLQCGYYILFEKSNSANDGTVATKPILLKLMPETGPINLTLKDASVFLDKDITGIKNPSKTDKANDYTVGIGDYVQYTITSRFPTYEHIASAPYSFAPTFTILDTMDDGLDTTKGFTLKVNDAELGKSTDETYNQAASYTLKDGTKNAATVSFSENNHSINIVFVDSYILAHQGQSIEFVYTAKVNDKVKTNDADGNNNKVELTYSNNPEVSSSTKKLEDEENVWSYSFNISKLNGATEEPLAGVKFNMYSNSNKLKFTVKNGIYYFDSNGTTTDIVSTSSGKVEIRGLDEGVYTIKEVETLPTYSLLMYDAVVTITAKRDNTTTLPTGACTISGEYTGITTNSNLSQTSSKDSSNDGTTDINAVIYNYKGVVLPETGSTTSIILMTVGGIVVLGGIIILIIFASKKKKDDEEENA